LERADIKPAGMAGPILLADVGQRVSAVKTFDFNYDSFFNLFCFSRAFMLKELSMDVLILYDLQT
jgi:hypothetical protein